ncbi:type II toxin-antitoxin system HicB family antitoxin [Desertibacillus haloalkaliphilus]|uniref:type II toxin-antitoxin system HicB family antitoxin n=1 Tax=Desertibacillus haloalkaliphilus TaxID=1328930 RepID=UPI001C269921|nr:type II toxin-antitoxin system HicB family antitoxin [Desertibacillus haloalkaliphilus]MBU8905256.1 type II toxin-antitoxin system HicB family antitoxin [Desertibacillus haloalkaliphilus]
MKTKEKDQLNSLLPLHSYSWLVRKQFNWIGGYEYLIELKEVEGCFSYGDTIAEAKKGLKEAMVLWVMKHGVEALPEPVHSTQLVYIQPPMTEEEFEQINYFVRQYK